MSAVRQYAILGLVGQGGQGKVYRARLTEGTFAKEVALKLLHPQIDALLLEDLREEARVQALLRDRAVVNVEPPLLLDGRWGLVMEFVDGMDLREACSVHGTLPPTVALEIIAEVARVLEKAWSIPGPDGAPLALQHCDIKPANIQITPSGEVRFLDLGAAQRAIAAASNSASTIAGTPGYVAPERMDGELTQTTDVYSLGVTLWKLLTGTRGRFQSERDIQDAIDDLGKDDAGLRSALQLAVSMRDPYPGRRPVPAEVRAMAIGLRRTLRGPDLGEWAARIEPRRVDTDEMTGVKLVVRSTLVPASPREVRRPVKGPGMGTLLGITFGLLAVIAVVVGLSAGVGTIGLARWAGAESPPVGAPAGAQLLTIESSPSGAEVRIDGTLVGTTPIADMVVHDGTYELHLAKGRFELRRPLLVGTQHPHRYHWEITLGSNGLRQR